MFTEFLSKHNDIIFLIAGISLAAFIVSIFLLPLIIIRLPEDFFVRAPLTPLKQSLARLLLRILKNFLGCSFFLIGIVMLFIPGQGILTILLGISLMDFPGKRRLEAKIVRTPRISKSLNWLREKAQRPPFILPDEN